MHNGELSGLEDSHALHERFEVLGPLTPFSLINRTRCH
jgi:hypothetical protein